MVGDPTALGDIAHLVYEPLTAQLRREFPEHAYPEADIHLLLEKAADAMLEYGRVPAQANAKSGAGVLGFLVLRAKSRVQSALRRERTRREAEGRFAHGLTPSRRTDSGKPVELRLARAEHSEQQAEGIAVPGDSESFDASRESSDRRDEVLRAVVDEQDRRLLQLMLDGVRKTEAYADVLGIAHLGINEQRKIVKQHKDRIKAAAFRRQKRKVSGTPRRGRPPRGRGGNSA